MSAFTVGNGHIDVLVNAAAQYGLITGGAGIYRALGDILWVENYRSVNHRYNEDEQTPGYVLHTTEAPLRPFAVINAVRCYAYQSDEHPGWETSDAKAITDRIVEAVESYLTPDELRMVPCQYDRSRFVKAYTQSAAYDAEPWEFDSVEQAAELACV